MKSETAQTMKDIRDLIKIIGREEILFLSKILFKGVYYNYCLFFKLNYVFIASKNASL